MASQGCQVTPFLFENIGISHCLYRDVSCHSDESPVSLHINIDWTCYKQTSKHKEASFIHRKPEYLYGHSNPGYLETSGSIQSVLLLPKILVIVESEEAVPGLIHSRWWCEQDRVRSA